MSSTYETHFSRDDRGGGAASNEECARGQVSGSELPRMSQAICRKITLFIFVCGFTLHEINVQAIAYAA
jgi:hypothetical protein